MKKQITILVFAIIFATTLYAQNGVSISEGVSSPHESAMLDVQSTTKGVLIPQMTSVQRDEISSPAIGLQIYNTSRKCIEFYTGTEWTSSVPAGTIQAYAGETSKIPDGWLLCDGTSILVSQYADLFDKIGFNFGGIYPNFNLPDLRGQFLRGADLQSGNDPDYATRTNGSTTEKIGSLQDDAFKSHIHSIGTYFGENSSPSNVGNIQGYGSEGPNGSMEVGLTGGEETRPKNVYINYIIKY